MRLRLCFAACLCLIGRAFTVSAAEPPVWPSPPDAPRIRYVETLPRATNNDAKAGKWKKALDFLLGIVSSKSAEEKLLRPTGLWVAGNNVYIADTGSGRIFVYDKLTGKNRWIPSERRRKMPSPVCVAVDQKGRIFVSDPVARQVGVFDAEGKFSFKLDEPPRAFARPTGLALDSKLSRLYVSDTGVHCVHAFNLEGKYLFSFGCRGASKGELNYPTYLWADSKTGRILVCDSGNFRVQIFDAEGNSLGHLGEMGDRPGYLARPRGTAVDSDGNIYSVDGAMETVQIFNEKGRLMLYFGENGAEAGYFSMPGGIFVDGEDRVYVADSFNSRVQVFQYIKEAGKL